MYMLYSFFVGVILCVLSYPYLKLYQMMAYKIKSFWQNLFLSSFKEDKNRLVFTKRMTRFCLFYLLTIWALFVPIFKFLNSFWLILCLCLVASLILPGILTVSHIIIYPLEWLIKFFYIEKTRRILKNFKGTKIAIVGSFGKTSLKNILCEILKTKFKVVMTPKNFNTPMGITKTVLTLLKKDTEIIIFEMGARKIGDIKQLVKIVDPDVGIMTAVGQQHLETFKSMEGVKKAKYELVEFMKDSGKIYFNGANETCVEFYKKCKKEKVLTCSSVGVSSFNEVNFDEKGQTFDLIIKTNRKEIRTPLLGRFNCENITLASTVAYDLGVDLEEIVAVVSKIKPIKNRLELIDAGSFKIIDDSYNANPIGCEEGLNVLNRFSGEKIVVTSGMVELGSLQYEKNYILGKQIASVANKVLIMNETNKKALFEGLLKEKFDVKNIYFATTRKEQKEVLLQIVSKGCVVLFQNDLPDNYR